MLLATLNIPAYTLQTEDVQVDPEDNRRYTMRDIGNLETRIKNIEYYTQLSLLEADAQGLYKYKMQMDLIDLKMDLLLITLQATMLVM
jgi:hypothetical protein